eukprot:5970450-Pleurochrysis_carterae.AAC.1
MSSCRARLWRGQFVLDPFVALQQIKDKWNAVFSSLPPEDDDVDYLPDSMKPQWVELPASTSQWQQQPGQPGQHGGPDAPVSGMGWGVSAALENPAVNPITGLGRSTDDVQHELNAHKGKLKQRLQIVTFRLSFTVFQADYLYIQLPGKDIELHR